MRSTPSSREGPFPPPKRRPSAARSSAFEARPKNPAGDGPRGLRALRRFRASEAREAGAVPRARRGGEPGRGSFGTVFSHGGHDIRAENNIFVDCKRALGSAPWDEARWRDALKGGQECFFPEKLLKEVDITKPPYLTHYPELVNYRSEEHTSE